MFYNAAKLLKRVRLIDFKTIKYTIPSKTLIEEVYYYTIHFTDTKDLEINSEITKWYNDFVELHQILTEKGFKDLPKLPRKFLINSESNLESRRVELEQYV